MIERACTCGVCLYCLAVAEPEYVRLFRPPSWWQRLAGYARAMWAHAKDGFRWAPSWLQWQRRQLCTPCEYRVKDGDWCAPCGCPLSGKLRNKIRVRSSRCPIGKW